MKEHYFFIFIQWTYILLPLLLQQYRIPENLNGVKRDPKSHQAINNIESVSSPIYLWFRTGSIEDYRNKSTFLRARITGMLKINVHGLFYYY